MFLSFLSICILILVLEKNLCANINLGVRLAAGPPRHIAKQNTRDTFCTRLPWGETGCLLAQQRPLAEHNRRSGLSTDADAATRDRFPELVGIVS